MTISDIAKLAGVSAATVSRVINKSGRVSAEIEKRVLKVIEDTHYSPNVTGRMLRTAQTKLLLVSLPTISNSFYSQIVKGIELRASAYGYNILLSPTQNQLAIELKYLQMLTSRQVDGMISFSTRLDIARLNLVASQYPFVLACECPKNAQVSCVSIDNQEAAFEATRILLEKGHQRIGMLSGKLYRTSASLREKGYKNALKEKGIEFDPSLISSCEYHHESGFAGMQKLMEGSNPPTALFCVCDDMAAGAIRYLDNAGLKAGRDVDIIGFDDTSIASMYLPSISSVSQPRTDIGTTAVDLLMEKIQDIHSTVKRVTLPHSIILRESVSRMK